MIVFSRWRELSRIWKEILRLSRSISPKRFSTAALTGRSGRDDCISGLWRLDGGAQAAQTAFHCFPGREISVQHDFQFFDFSTEVFIKADREFLGNIGKRRSAAEEKLLQWRTFHRCDKAIETACFEPVRHRGRSPR